MPELFRYISRGYKSNSYLLTSGNKGILIDASVKPEEFPLPDGVTVTDIILTHGHFDHICAADLWAEKYGCRLYISEKDAPMLQDPHKNASALFSISPVTVRSPYSFLPVSGKLECSVGSLTVIPTPGHTAGSVTIKSDNYLFTGDTLFSGSVGRTDLPGGSGAQLRESLKRIQTLDEALEILPGHGDTSTLDFEKRNNIWLA